MTKPQGNSIQAFPAEYKVAKAKIWRKRLKRILATLKRLAAVLMELKMIKIWRQSAEACQSSGAEEREEKPNIRYLLSCSFCHFGLGLGGGGAFSFAILGV